MNDDSGLLSGAVTPLLYWYSENKRTLPWRSDPTPYHVWISEIMLQQTRVEAVKPYYTRFLETLPTVKDLAEVDETFLYKLWEGLGYYSRARNLQKCARVLTEKYDGELPSDLETLKTLPGIGPYTAGAISSIAFGNPTPAVDGNVLRVVTRVCGCEDDITLSATVASVREALEKIYPTKPDEASAFTQALMELGAVVCIPNGEPLCDACPLAFLCRAGKEGKTDRIPVKAPKKPRKIIPLTVMIPLCGGKIGLRKRPKSGMLAGMWELPNYEGHLDEEELPVKGKTRPVGRARHIFTHREWDMVGYETETDEPLPGLTYVTKEEIKEKYALASAFSYYRSIALGGETED